MEQEVLTETFEDQLATGAVCEAVAAEMRLPSLRSPRGQPIRMNQCLWRGVTVLDPEARRLHVQDCRIESCDLANMDFTESWLERVEIVSTRLTGVIFADVKFKSVLFQECKLDFAVMRMAKMQQCVFERCNITDADFYEADLSGTDFRGCDLSRTDISHTKLAGADIRDCRLDGMRGIPADTNGLIISPDQAALLITLFGVRVAW